MIVSRAKKKEIIERHQINQNDTASSTIQSFILTENKK